jgi:hypothetical protein
MTLIWHTTLGVADFGAMQKEFQPPPAISPPPVFSHNKIVPEGFRTTVLLYPKASQLAGPPLGSIQKMPTLNIPG